jgi:tetratricopeptide (TPR) repeat protein
MKKIAIAAVAALLLTAQFSYAGGKKDLDEAIEAVVVDIEGRVAKGTPIKVYKITADHDEIGDYIAKDLNDRISVRGNLITVAGGADLQIVDAEQKFQMSGIVSDESAVRIGKAVGAKFVIIGEIKKYDDFWQLRVRAVNVEKLESYSSEKQLINKNDRVLANITAPLGKIQAPRITENALDRLNRGKDLYAESKYDEAIAEFDKALAINRNLAEAYFYRGTAYSYKGNYDRAIADYDQAIRLNPNYAEAYGNRGIAYSDKGNYDRAIANYEQVIRLNPNDALAYNNRGNAYSNKGNKDRAIADFDQAIRLNPNYANAYNNRGATYSDKGDNDRAIADYTQAIRLNPNDAVAYYNRGLAYVNKNDYDRAIADYTQAIRLNSNDADAYNNRGAAYYMKKDYDKAIADYETALRIDPNCAPARTNLEQARRARGR